ncbi:MAG: pyridoxamine 5'-phosphate oxidase [Robiginitomaculum sp.]|nr:MAG: pyridoxamine 5'-phosphate oxidase [Robiginitomaculum sp.]
MTKIIPPSPNVREYTQDEKYLAIRKANEAPIFDRDDPFALFADWMVEARANEPNDSNAMALATVDKDGLPDVRMVLLKGVDEKGFVFFSHGQSAKGQELAHTAKAALNFHWKSLRRQIRIRGSVQEVTTEEVVGYFATRARDSQIGAWASRQSTEMESRDAFEQALADYTQKFEGGDVPLPDGWKGWRVTPLQIEFWRDKPFRLHDRLEFRRENLSQGWTKRRLYP